MGLFPKLRQIPTGNSHQDTGCQLWLPHQFVPRCAKKIDPLTTQTIRSSTMYVMCAVHTDYILCVEGHSLRIYTDYTLYIEGHSLRISLFQNVQPFTYNINGPYTYNMA